MSHFTVGVILDNPKGDNKKLERDLEKELAPFQENNEGTCPKQYLEFHSVTEEEKGTYENGTVTKVRCPDGKLVSPYDEMFRVEGTIGLCFSAVNPSHKVPENAGFEKVEIPYKDLYPTFEDYMSEYCEYEFDEEMQDYGYWENPNAKWDWWQVGGRFRDNLLVKGKEFVKGERGFLDLSEDEKAPDGYTWASGGVIKDIDFEKMKEEKYKNRIKLWEDKIENSPIYDRFIKRYGTKENYAKEDLEYYTYALLIDGKWISKGEMGWWGVDDSTRESHEVYIEKFKEIMSAEENQDKLFVVVDCHI